HLAAKAGADGVALVLGDGETLARAQQLRAVFQKQPACDGKISDAAQVRPAHKPVEAAPTRRFELDLEPVNACARKCDGEAYAGVEQKIVVRKIADVAAIDARDRKSTRLKLQSPDHIV